MDALAQRALQELRGDLRELLAEPDPQVTPAITLGIVRVLPTGIGGYVGPHVDPEGDCNGRRVHSTVLIDVRGANPDDLADRVAAVSATMLSVRSDRPTAGQFLRVEQRGADPEQTVSGQPGGQTRRTRLLHFDVVYEVVATPEDAAGLLDQIDFDLHLSPTGRAPRPLFHERFMGGILDRFQVSDDLGANNHTPSDWVYDDTEWRIDQRSQIWGGTTGTTANLPGTALLLGPTVPSAADVLVRSQMASGERGIGLVFRWQDPDNYYFVLLDATAGFRRIGRKVAGAFADLDEAAFDDGAGYPTGQPFDLKLEAFGPRMQVWFDGEPILGGADASITVPGRVGLLCRRNPTARYWSFHVAAL